MVSNLDDVIKFDVMVITIYGERSNPRPQKLRYCAVTLDTAIFLTTFGL